MIEDDPVVVILRNHGLDNINEEEAAQISTEIREAVVKPLGTYIGDDFRTAGRIIIQGF